MFKFISILSLFILFHGDDIEEVSWNENYKLTWSDFKGAPNNQTESAFTKGEWFKFEMR